MWRMVVGKMERCLSVTGAEKRMEDRLLSFLLMDGVPQRRRRGVCCVGTK